MTKDIDIYNNYNTKIKVIITLMISNRKKQHGEILHVTILETALKP